MKAFNLTLVAAFAFAITLTECGLIGKSGNLINLTVISVDTSIYAYLKVNVTALNSPKPLQLPLNSTETKGLTYVSYECPFIPDESPKVWNTTFGISADLFDDQSYITLELYGMHVLVWRVFFDGGAEMTVGAIKQKPHNFEMPLIDQNDIQLGTIKLAWQ